MVLRLLNNKIFDDVKFFIRKFDSLLYSFINELVEPVYSSKIPTAAVAFSRKDTSVCVKFMFNENFWKSLNYNEKNFVFTHELLHVIFRHGLRGQQYFNTLPKEKRNFKLLNICQDICINQIIIEQYMSDIPHIAIPIINDLCFIKTVFEPKHHHLIEHDQSFIYYYEKYVELYGIKKIPDNVRLLDVHSLGDDSDMGEEPLTDEELEELEDLLDELEESMSEKGIDIDELEDLMKGKGFSDAIDFSAEDKVEIVKRGKTLDDLFNIVIKKAFAKKYDIARKSNWFGFDRRTSGALARMSPDLNLPVIAERKKEIPKRHKVLIYLDMSGSCKSYSEKFMTLVANLPEEKYESDIRVFADRICKVEVINANGVKNFKYGRAGFGTNIAQVIKDAKNVFEKEKFDAVFVLTDGFYSEIKYDKTHDYSNWYFFLTPSSKENIPKQASAFKIGKI